MSITLLIRLFKWIIESSANVFRITEQHVNASTEHVKYNFLVWSFFCLWANLHLSDLCDATCDQWLNLISLKQVTNIGNEQVVTFCPILFFSLNVPNLVTHSNVRAIYIRFWKILLISFLLIVCFVARFPFQNMFSFCC